MKKHLNKKLIMGEENEKKKPNQVTLVGYVKNLLKMKKKEIIVI